MLSFGLRDMREMRELGLLIWGLIFWLILERIGRLSEGLIDKLIFWLSEGLSKDLSEGLILGLTKSPSSLKIKLIEKFSFFKTTKEKFVEMLSFGLRDMRELGWLIKLIFGLSGGLIVGLSGGLISGLSGGLIFGLSGGLIFGLIFGGNSCIQHFALRLILYFNRYIPWNYAHFLDYSTERLFLQRVGGRYRFVHKLLQDHFAKMEFKRN